MKDLTQYKAIETLHSGYKFRSRLEARWSIFFETLGIEYRYEPEGFALDGLNYLPDFYLPKFKQWIEIKPIAPTPEEREKAIRLCLSTGEDTAILSGDVWSNVQVSYFFRTYELSKDEVDKIYCRSDGFASHWLTSEECIIWGKFAVTGINILRQIVWQPASWEECAECNQVSLNMLGLKGCKCRSVTTIDESLKLNSAYAAARQARFEYKKSRSEEVAL